MMKLNPAYHHRRMAYLYLALMFTVTLAVFWVVMLFVIPLMYLVGSGFSDWSKVGSFYKETLSNLFYPLKAWFMWFYNYTLHEPAHYTWKSFFAWKVPILPTLAFIITCGYWIVKNPWEYLPQYFGSGHEARLTDLKKMGLLTGKFLFIGKFEGRKMKMAEPRSAFCIGTIQSGKTCGVVIPNILEADNASLFIHDPKGELSRMTSGYRATKGPTFTLDFSLVDKPEEGVFHPCWNPLAEGNLPPQYHGRDGYIATLVDFLIPEGGEGSDPYWVKAGRAALLGLTIYICNKVEQAQANDYFLARLFEKSFNNEDADVLLSYYQGMQQTPEVRRAIQFLQDGTLSYRTYVPVGTWDPLPRQWIGKEPSFGMLLDLLNNWMFSKTKELRRKIEEGDPAAVDMDVWQIILDVLVNETFLYGYGRRCLLELNEVLSLPDKQRASVISMAQSGIDLFKNSAIRNRTSSNDFTYKDLRGMKNPETGVWEPVTFYVNNEGGAVCSLFINMVCEHLLENGPNEGGMGPFPVEFLLDDFGRMPKLQCIADGIAFGRSKYNIFLVVVHDWNQIKALYGANMTDVILNSVGVKIVKRHNNVDTRGRMLQGLTQLTRLVRAGSKAAYGFSKSTNYLTHQVGGIKLQADGVIGGSGILSMAPEKQLVLMTGWGHRPIQAQCPLCYKNDGMKAKTSMPPAPNVPAYMLEKKKKKGEKTLEIQLDSIDV